METPEDVVRAERLRRNLLTPGAGGADAGAVVAALCGIQAQDLPAARLAVRARSAGLTDAGVEAARVEQRSVVRTWAMRGTLHLVAAGDLGWLRRLFLPGAIRAGARRFAQLGLDERAYRRAAEIIGAALAGGRPASRSSLREALAAGGVDPSGQRAAWLFHRAAMEGLICEGPAAGREPSYVLVESWLGTPAVEPGDRERDLARLASRYLAAYGPAAPEDLAAWSGLPLEESRKAFRLVGGRLTEIGSGERPLWTVGPAAGAPAADPVRVKLLPAFDTFLLGYRDRRLHLEPRHAHRVNAGGGVVRPVLLIDGRVAGTWRLLRRKLFQVVVRPFDHLPDRAQAGLEEEVRDIGRFSGRPAGLSFAEPYGPA